MNGSPGLLQRRKNKTRQALIDAATQLFASRGYENTTVEQIARTAGVSRRTFFRYFKYKDLVAFPHHKQHVLAFRQLLKDEMKNRQPYEGVKSACFRMAGIYMDGTEEHLKQAKVIQSSPELIVRGEKFDQDWQAAISDALIDGDNENRDLVINCKLIAGVVMGLIRSSMALWYEGECKEDLVELAELAFSMVVIKDDYKSTINNLFPDNYPS